MAEGIACELPLRGRQVLQAIRNSSGTAIAVSEAEIADASLRLAGSGYYAEPTAAVGFAGLSRLRDQDVGELLGDTPVVIVSGAGLKAGSLLADLRSPGWRPASD